MAVAVSDTRQRAAILLRHPDSISENIFFKRSFDTKHSVIRQPILLQELKNEIKSELWISAQSCSSHCAPDVFNLLPWPFFGYQQINLGHFEGDD
jgi:hypothetical protein